LTDPTHFHRCYPDAEGVENAKLFRPSRPPNITAIRPEAQNNFYVLSWQDDRQYLYNKYLLNLTENSNLTQAEAKRIAYQESFQMASGGISCDLNSAASGKV